MAEEELATIALFLRILDEREQIIDMMVEGEMREPGSRTQARHRDAAKKAKAQRRQADKARRQNRGKG